MSNIVKGEKKDSKICDSKSLKEECAKASQKEILGENGNQTEKSKQPDKTIGHEKMKDMSEEEMSEIGRKKAEELTKSRS